MAISREKKEQIVEEFTEIFKNVKGVAFVSFSGLSVEDISSLRRTLKKEQSQIKVIKNTLLEIIFQRLGLSLPEFILEGPTAVAYNADDEIALFKAIYQFSKEKENLVIKGGVFNNEIIDKQGVINLASLPSKKELQAKLVFALKSPLSRFVGALKYHPIQLVSILKAYSEKIQA